MQDQGWQELDASPNLSCVLDSDLAEQAMLLNAALVLGHLLHLLPPTHPPFQDVEPVD